MIAFVKGRLGLTAGVEVEADFAAEGRGIAGLYWGLGASGGGPDTFDLVTGIPGDVAVGLATSRSGIGRLDGRGGRSGTPRLMSVGLPFSSATPGLPRGGEGNRGILKPSASSSLVSAIVSGRSTSFAFPLLCRGNQGLSLGVTLDNGGIAKSGLCSNSSRDGKLEAKWAMSSSCSTTEFCLGGTEASDVFWKDLFGVFMPFDR